MQPNQSHHASSRGGFTLIELLVVMAILTTLGALGFAGVSRALRAQDRTVCIDRLKMIHQSLFSYQEMEGSMPRVSGPEFVLAPWERKLVDHTFKDAEIYFCPTMTGKPDDQIPLEEAVMPDEIDFTGPDLSLYKKKVLRLQDRNAADTVIVANKVATVETDEDIAALPHQGYGICYLTLNGGADYIEAVEFGEYVIIGPDSPLEKFQRLVVTD